MVMFMWVSLSCRLSCVSVVYSVKARLYRVFLSCLRGHLYLDISRGVRSGSPSFFGYYVVQKFEGCTSDVIAYKQPVPVWAVVVDVEFAG